MIMTFIIESAFRSRGTNRIYWSDSRIPFQDTRYKPVWYGQWPSFPVLHSIIWTAKSGKYHYPKAQKDVYQPADRLQTASFPRCRLHGHNGKSTVHRLHPWQKHPQKFTTQPFPYIRTTDIFSHPANHRFLEKRNFPICSIGKYLGDNHTFSPAACPQ